MFPRLETKDLKVGEEQWNEGEGIDKTSGEQKGNGMDRTSLGHFSDVTFGWLAGWMERMRLERDASWQES